MTESSKKERWFVSHPHLEKLIVEEALSAFAENKELIWFHREELDVYTEVSFEIANELSTCTGLIWVDSNYARTRDWITWEIDYARRSSLAVLKFELEERKVSVDEAPPVPFHIYPIYCSEESEVRFDIFRHLQDRKVNILDPDSFCIPGDGIVEHLHHHLDRTSKGFGFGMIFVSRNLVSSRWAQSELMKLWEDYILQNREKKCPIFFIIQNKDLSSWVKYIERTMPEEMLKIFRQHHFDPTKRTSSLPLAVVSASPTEREKDNVLVTAYQAAYRNAGER